MAVGAFGAELSTNLLPDKNICGDGSNFDRIHGGIGTGLYGFPWLVLLEHRKENGKSLYPCGGVLISKRYVLTAAHCATKINGSRTWNMVRLGDYDIERDDDCVPEGFGGRYICNNPISVSADDVIIHSDYEHNNPNEYHDIAIVRLAEDVEFTDFIKPICLPLSKEDVDTIYNKNLLTVVGWGKTENRKKLHSDIKLEVKLPLLPNSYCNNRYKHAIPARHVNSSQLCAGGEKGKDACGGDSGGPLMGSYVDSDGNSNWILAGIVSYGSRECGLESVAGVFTKVSEYVPWILDNLKP